MPHVIGTDIVETSRIEALIRNRGEVFLQRWFTAREIAYCSRKAVPGRHFAARFAAKEAVVKALPIRWRASLPWRSIEIVNDGCGAPSIELSGAFSHAAASAGIGEITVSLSHCEQYATAVALAEVAGPAGTADREGGRSR